MFLVESLKYSLKRYMYSKSHCQYCVFFPVLIRALISRPVTITLCSFLQWWRIFLMPLCKWEPFNSISEYFLLEPIFTMEVFMIEFDLWRNDLSEPVFRNGHWSLVLCLWNAPLKQSDMFSVGVLCWSPSIASKLFNSQLSK